MDYNEKEILNLQFQLRHFIIDARQASSLNNLSTIQDINVHLWLQPEKIKFTI